MPKKAQTEVYSARLRQPLLERVRLLGQMRNQKKQDIVTEALLTLVAQAPELHQADGGCEEQAT